MVTGDGAELLRRLVDELPAMVAYWDRDLRLVVANPAYCRFVGRPVDQARGQHFSTVLGEEVHRANLPHLRAALAGERRVFERTLADGRGETRHTEVSYSPDVVDDQVVGIFAMITDVTDRVEARLDLDEAQELAGVASWSFRPADQTSTWSRHLYRLAGLQPDHGPADWEAYLAMVHPEDRALVASMRERAAQGRTYEGRYRLVVDGEVRHVHSRTKRVLDSHGEVVLVRGTIRDETELIRQADALEVANRRLADVIAMVGHDVRQPLGVVLGHLEMHLDDQGAEEGVDAEVDAGDPHLRHVGKALSAARRMDRMLDDILTMVTLDSGALVVSAQRADLGRLVADILAQEEHLAVPPHLEIRSSAVVTVDPFHVRQILANLLTNAGRHGSPPVTVQVDTTGSHALLRVTDCGQGVPAAFVPHLFDRFARADGVQTSRSPGSGFGLHIVRELARANGGTIDYRRADPTGAEFTASFPRAVPDPASTAHRGAGGDDRA